MIVARSQFRFNIVPHHSFSSFCYLRAGDASYCLLRNFPKESSLGQFPFSQRPNMAVLAMEGVRFVT